MVITHTDTDVSPGTTNLDIIDLKFTDFGTYTCVASLRNGGILEISSDVNISSTTGETRRGGGALLEEHSVDETGSGLWSGVRSGSDVGCLFLCACEQQVGVNGQRVVKTFTVLHLQDGAEAVDVSLQGLFGLSLGQNQYFTCIALQAVSTAPPRISETFSVQMSVNNEQSCCFVSRTRETRCRFVSRTSTE